MSRIRAVSRELCPPALATLVKRLAGRSASGLTYLESWPAADATGWDDPSVVATQEQRWRAFERSLMAPRPLAISPEGDPTTLSASAEHLFLAFAYAVSRAAESGHVSVLDWGGGLGQYYLVAKALFPDRRFEYVCEERPGLAEAGRRLNPEVRFITDGQSIDGQRFDLTFASGSVQYAEDWRAALATICSRSRNWMYLTRLPVVDAGATYVARQNASSSGYETTYPGWVFKLSELLDALAGLGLEVEREFYFGAFPRVKGARTQPEYRGFLLRR